MYLRQSTASQEILLGRFVSSTDGDTESTGLTIANTDITLHKHGATTLASKNSGGATHIANGLYYAVLDATDTDTLGNLEVHVHVSGALAIRREYVVLPANVFDALVLGTDVLQADVTQFGGSNLTAASGVPEVKTASLGTTAKADVNAEVVDCLTVDVLADSIATTGSRPTIGQALLAMTRFMLTRRRASGTTMTAYKEDNSTSSMTFTMNDATTPTDYSRD